MKSTLFTVVVLVALLAAALAVMVWAWREIGEVDISGHGIVALVLGAGFSLLVGGGLMALVFFSSRRGYDEEAHRTSRSSDGDDDQP